MSSEILKKIKQKIQDRVTRKELYSVFTNSEEIKLISDCISSIKNGERSQKESDLLKDIYAGLDSIFSNISADWDSSKGSLSSEKIHIHYQNLESIFKIVTLIEGLKTGLSRAYVILNLDEPRLICDVTSLQKKMKEALGKMQQQQNEARKKEIEKKAKEEFGKYIKNCAIDAVSIEKYDDCSLCDAVINLKDESKSINIEISEFLNNDFRKKHNIHEIRILNGDQEEVICGFVDKNGVRCYNLGTAAQYGIKFNWYIGERECSITLSANSNGTIKIVGDRPTDKDLGENKDVKIKVGDTYRSLADAVQMCEQKEGPSNTMNQVLANEHFRPLVKTQAKCF